MLKYIRNAINDLEVEKQYGISDRHRAAIQFLDMTPVDALRLGLSIVAQHPDRMVAEYIGTDEKSVNFRFYNVTESDVELIEKLSQQLDVHSPSAVVRNAIEALIDCQNLVQYRKKPNWKSRPFNLKTAGRKGRNPTPPHPHPYRGKSISIPMWLWQKLPTDSNFSQFARSLVDNASPEGLHPLTAAERKGDKRRITVQLFDYQHQRLTELKQQLPEFQSEGQMLLALLKQAASKS
jgi:hypothetical protein